jgi:hypothetical protein
MFNISYAINKICIIILIMMERRYACDVSIASNSKEQTPTVEDVRIKLTKAATA